MSMRAGLNGVKEEEGEEDEYGDDWEWEYYYENEGNEDELQCMSPSSTCAPTTRATSPFPDKLPQERQVQTPKLSKAFEITGSPNWEEAGRVSVASIPVNANANEVIVEGGGGQIPTRQTEVKFVAVMMYF